MQKLKHELTALGLLMLYFGCWIAGLIFLKQLVLAEYHIPFSQLSLALIGALILAKVVLILEHVSLGEWVRTRPAWVDVVLRTVLYSFGVVVVLLLEKGLEGRREHGGFGAALSALYNSADAHHVWANTICISAALLFYNALSVVRAQLGGRAFLKLFLDPLPEAPKRTSGNVLNGHQPMQEKATR